MGRGRRQAGCGAACWPTRSGGKTPALLHHPLLLFPAFTLAASPPGTPLCTPCRSQPAHSPHLIATHSSDLCCNTPSSRKPSRMHPGWVRCLVVRAPYGPMPSWHLNHTKSPSPSHQSVSTSRHKVPPLFSSVSRARLVLNTSVKCILKATSPSALEHSLSSAPVLPSAAYHPPG